MEDPRNVIFKDSDSTEYIYKVSKELVELIPDYNKFPLMSETDKILNCKNDYCTLIQNDYLLSKCFRNSYTIPLDMNRSNNVFGMKLDSINSKFLKNDIKEKEESYKKDLDFTNFINKTKSLNTNKWTILFQLKLSNIDSVSKDLTYFDKDVGYNENRFVLVYLIGYESNPLIVYQYNKDKKKCISLKEINFIKKDKLDTIECIDNEGNKLYINGKDEGTISIERTSKLESIIPINSKSSFNNPDNNFNNYKCDIITLNFKCDSCSNEEIKPFINVFIGSDDMINEDYETDKTFKDFYKEKINHYKDLIKNRNYLTGKYETIKDIYNYIIDNISKKDFKMPISDLFLYIAINYRYEYEVEGKECIKNHYFSKMVDYKINSSNKDNIKVTEDKEINFNKGEVIIVNDNFKEQYKFIASVPLFKMFYDESLGEDGYIIDFNDITINKLNVIRIDGDLEPIYKSDLNNITDYLINNGINIEHLTTKDDKGKEYFIQMDYQGNDNVLLKDVKISTILIKCIPASRDISKRFKFDECLNNYEIDKDINVNINIDVDFNNIK